MDSLPAARLAAHLNAARATRRADLEYRGDPGAAHHVVDPEGVLGLDPLAATELDVAMPALFAAEPDGWFLALPVPGSLAPLRGPAAFNVAALEAGQAVVASAGGVGLVPYRIGRGVQWRVFRAERPSTPSTPYEAERALSEALLATSAALGRLDVAGGARPSESIVLTLPPGYGARQRATADRAVRLLAVCDAALAEDGGAVSAYESGQRTHLLRRLRAHAADALAAAVNWPS